MPRTYGERKAHFLEVIDRPLSALGRFALVSLIILYYIGAWRLLGVIFPLLDEDIMNNTKIAMTIFSPIGLLMALLLMNMIIYAIRWLLTGKSNHMLFAKMMYEHNEDATSVNILLACAYAFYLLFGKRSKIRSSISKDDDLRAADAEIDQLLSRDPLAEKIQNL